jgi:photosystem II stability/assembly factor-like uncharacterized protein
MTEKIYLATEQGLGLIERSGDKWQGKVQLEGENVQCVAVDSNMNHLVYCGTLGNGVFRSDDAGVSWHPCTTLANQKVTSLAILGTEEAKGPGVIYAGTEPSAIYRSIDGGRTWDALPTLLDLPSSNEWSFPPRPYTHHVRYMLFDPCFRGRVHAAIEAGALLRSEDGGENWRDRVPGGPKDTHTLAGHKKAPGRLYSAAGDGYFESTDDGDTWRLLEDGLDRRYCWSIAVSFDDPDTMVMTAARTATTAHTKLLAHSFVYRRTAGEPWREAMSGIDGSLGRRVGVVARSEVESDVFYVSSEGELYRSETSGLEWQKLRIEYAGNPHIGHALDIAILEPGS